MFFAGNYHASQGKYTVTEGFIETVVPLAQNAPFAQSLDFNGAVRWTDYSTSGDVVTWKAGALVVLEINLLGDLLRDVIHRA